MVDGILGEHKVAGLDESHPFRGMNPAVDKLEDAVGKILKDKKYWFLTLDHGIKDKGGKTEAYVNTGLIGRARHCGKFDPADFLKRLNKETGFKWRYVKKGQRCEGHGYVADVSSFKEDVELDEASRKVKVGIVGFGDGFAVNFWPHKKKMYYWTGKSEASPTISWSDNPKYAKVFPARIAAEKALRKAKDDAERWMKWATESDGGHAGSPVLGEAKKRYVKYEIGKSDVPGRGPWMATLYRANGKKEYEWGRTKGALEKAMASRMKFLDESGGADIKLGKAIYRKFGHEIPKDIISIIVDAWKDVKAGPKANVHKFVDALSRMKISAFKNLDPWSPKPISIGDMREIWDILGGVKEDFNLDSVRRLRGELLGGDEESVSDDGE
jgi:hypothetical protein